MFFSFKTVYFEGNFWLVEKPKLFPLLQLLHFGTCTLEFVEYVKNMGGKVSRSSDNSVSAAEHDEALEGRGRKRSRDEDDTDSETEQLMRTPQR